MHLAIRRGWEDELLALATASGFGTGATLRDYPQGLLPDEADEAPREVQLQFWMSATAFVLFEPWLEQLRSAWALTPEELGIVSDAATAPITDPEALWQSHWKPFRCAGFSLRAPFHQASSLPTRPGDLPLLILPGSAFGNGFHPTTRMALKAVRRMHDESKPAAWLDVGTGSGILAVAAALLGAPRVHALDPDPQSPPQALRMAELNGVAGQITLWRGGLDSARGQYPAVVANLFADLLQDSARTLAKLLLPGGCLYAGGIVDRRAALTEQRLEAAGLQCSGRLESGRWRGSQWRRLHP